MSWAISAAILSGKLDWPLAPGSYPYEGGWQDQYDLPAWLRQTRRSETQDDFQTNLGSWQHFRDWLLQTLPPQAVSQQGWALLLFAGQMAQASLAMLNQAGGHGDAALLSFTRQLLEELNADETGVLRLYEWGKF
ncbi:hypothetical protein [Chitinilyticum piscinae]|uniref:Uncharacterized protein n=1 Tax=Chitinilyticum piscinae TaxID=2866724 RepID=A0A8J7KB96_9NEIS|nr:hypothetical protein [Chitinilyticum piscinae]MBE9609994.1 hypothetical protein [Chitinilyticum piscinae]